MLLPTFVGTELIAMAIFWYRSCLLGSLLRASTPLPSYKVFSMTPPEIPFVSSFFFSLLNFLIASTVPFMSASSVNIHRLEPLVRSPATSQVESAIAILNKVFFTARAHEFSGITFLSSDTSFTVYPSSGRANANVDLSSCSLTLSTIPTRLFLFLTDSAPILTVVLPHLAAAALGLLPSAKPPPTNPTPSILPLQTQEKIVPQNLKNPWISSSKQINRTRV
mmetsp:Transcript_23207/g.92601  ORF Transcript_23207/g.92601 Transcript_23207/m.92601 type:complete len:222 (-) Transcript_23207:110-775(-)